MNNFISQQDNLITPDDLYALIKPYILTVQNSKTHLLTPAQSNGLVLIIVEVLMDNYTNKEGLRLLSSVLNTDSYEELCNERVINHYCGYPLCGNYDPNKIKPINNKTNLKFLKSYYNNSYCTKLHYQSNEFYKKQLSDEAMFLRTDLFQPNNGIIFLDELMDEINNTNNKEKSMLSIIEDMRHLSIVGNDDAKTSELAGLVEDFEIVENVHVDPPSQHMVVDDGYGLQSNDVNLDEKDDQFIRGKSIEGYVTR